MHACIYTAELKTIKLPPKMRKRGQPKGAETTVIGLPKRRKRSNKTVPFLKKLPSEVKKVHSQCMCMQLLYMLTYPAVILQWFVDATSADAAVCKKNYYRRGFRGKARESDSSMFKTTSLC